MMTTGTVTVSWSLDRFVRDAGFGKCLASPRGRERLLVDAAHAELELEQQEVRARGPGVELEQQEVRARGPGVELIVREGAQVEGRVEVPAGPRPEAVVAVAAAEVAEGEPAIPKATHKGVLRIGDIAIPCYVLDDGRRVLSRRGLTAALGMARRGNDGDSSGDRIDIFLASNAISPCAEKRNLAGTKPFIFDTSSVGMAYGSDATLLADICDVVLDARRAGAIGKRYAEIANRCELLISGFARLGIIAHVDNATGYQAVRPKGAFDELLAEYISPEKAPWSKTFPDAFYRELFRLQGWPYEEETNVDRSWRREDAENRATSIIMTDKLLPRLSPALAGAAGAGTMACSGSR